MPSIRATVMLYGACAALVGPFLVWQHINDQVETGVALVGPVLPILAAAMLAGAIGSLIKKAVPKPIAILSLLFALLVATHLFDAMRAVAKLEIPDWARQRSALQFGFYLTLLGHLAVVFAATWSLIARPRVPAPQAIGNPDTAAQNRSALGQALLVAIICASGLAAIGAEVRVLLSNGRGVAQAALLIIAYIVLGIIGSRISFDKAMLLIRAQPAAAAPNANANPQIAKFVLDRATKLAVSRPFRLAVAPRTANLRNAYLRMAVNGGIELVLTEGAEFVFFADREAFQFMIDHELGHLLANDAGLLQLAGGFLAAALILFPVKLVLLILRSESYQSLFPVAARMQLPDDFMVMEDQGQQVPLIWQIPVAQPVSHFTIVVFLGSLTLFLMLVSTSLYVYCIRLREYWGDRFAAGHAESASERPLAELLRTDVAKPQWFHPSCASRIRAISASEPPYSRFWAATDGLILVSLVLFRFVLGSTGLEDNPPAPIMGLFSVLFFVAFYVSVSLTVEEIRENGKRSWRARVFGMLLLSATAGGLLAFFLRAWLRTSNLDEATLSMGLTHLNNAQEIDYLSLAASVPVATMACVACTRFVEVPLRRRIHHTAWIARAAGIAATAVLLFAGAAAIQPWTLGIKQRELRRYRETYLARVTEQRRLPRDLLAAKAADFAELTMRLLYISYDYRAVCIPDARLGRQRFTPPTALFDLAQGPLRTNPFDARYSWSKRARLLMLVFLQSGSRLSADLTFDQWNEHVENLGRFDCGYFDAVVRTVVKEGALDEPPVGL